MEASYGQTESAFGGDNGDSTLLVRFLKLPWENKVKSKEENRPIFEECDYIEIAIPGNKDEIRCRKALARDKIRFPKHWAAYEARTANDEVLEGTLLDEWSGVTRSQVEELRFYHIRTVEQLAAFPDVNAQNIRGSATLKAKAKQFLEESTSNEELSRQLAAQKKQIDELIAAAAGHVAEIPADTKPKRTRRTKAEMEAQKKFDDQCAAEIVANGLSTA